MSMCSGGQDVQFTLGFLLASSSAFWVCRSHNKEPLNVILLGGVQKSGKHLWLELRCHVPGFALRLGLHGGGLVGGRILLSEWQCKLTERGMSAKSKSVELQPPHLFLEQTLFCLACSPTVWTGNSKMCRLDRRHERPMVSQDRRIQCGNALKNWA